MKASAGILQGESATKAGNSLFSKTASLGSRLSHQPLEVCATVAVLEQCFWGGVLSGAGGDGSGRGF